MHNLCLLLKDATVVQNAVASAASSPASVFALASALGAIMSWLLV
jgi:hypothetical protein